MCWFKLRFVVLYYLVWVAAPFVFPLIVGESDKSEFPKETERRDGRREHFQFL